MSILIKGMTLPQNCDECVMRYVDHRGYIMCELTHQLVKSGAKDRYDNCPLVEIPTPHGRLGDLDKLKADCSMKDDCAECEKELQGSSRACEYDRIYSKMDFCQWIDNAETVIEAEGETE